MAYQASLVSFTQSNGHDIANFDNGTTLDLGQVVGATGATGAVGATGATGSTGAAGVGLANITINPSTGHYVITKTDGTTSDGGAAPGIGGDPILNVAFTSAAPTYNLKSTDFAGPTLQVFLDASAAAGTFSADAGLIYGGTTTPATTKKVVVTRVDTIAANAVGITGASGQTLRNLTTVPLNVAASFTLTARSASALVIN